MKQTDLKELRCSRKMTLAEMADQLGVSIGYVGHLETGFRKLNDDLIKRFADILNVPQKVIREAAEQIERKNALANSWLTQIKINGYPLLDAFKYHAATAKPELEDKAKIREQIVKFVTDNLPFSVMAEISSNEQLLDQVIERCRD